MSDYKKMAEEVDTLLRREFPRLYTIPVQFSDDGWCMRFRVRAFVRGEKWTADYQILPEDERRRCPITAKEVACRLSQTIRQVFPEHDNKKW